MEVPADLRQPGHGVQEAIAHVPRMRAREPDPIDARNLVDRFEQPGEVAVGIVRRRVVIHDLAEQLHFAMPGLGRLPHLGQDVGLGPHPLVAARVGHDAEAAELVAPFDDRDVGLHRIAAMGDAERKRDVFVQRHVDERHAARRRACSTSIGRRRMRLCADHDVGDARRPLEQRRAFLLRDATGDGDDRMMAALGAELAQLAETRVELLLGALPDAAGVDDDDVRVGLVERGLEPGLIEQSRHPLGVVHVHLAAEGLDQVFARHASVSPCASRGRATGRLTFAFAFRVRFAFRPPCAAGCWPSSSISRADGAHAAR